MNSKVVVIILVLVAIVGGAIIFSQQKEQKTTLIQEQEDTSVPQADSRYLDYSPASFELRKNDRRVLYFHADWCPTCRPLDAAFSKDPNQIPKGVVLFKTSYDKETALKTKYGITYQHTFVEVDAAGNAVQTWSGGTVDDVVSRLQ